MLWILLAAALSGAIIGLAWLRYRQEQSWRRELAYLQEDETSEWPEEEKAFRFADLWAPLTGKGFGTGSNTLARLRLMAGRKREQADEDEAVSEYGDFQYGQFESAEENPQSEGFFEEEIQKPATQNQSKEPDIVPFVETEIPEYIPRTVTSSDLEEITGEEVQRSLTEAAIEEWAQYRRDKKRAVIGEVEDEEEVPLIRASVTPMKGLQIIDFNDPMLRRTRERVIAGVREIQAAQNSRARFEIAQTALKSVEYESAPVENILETPSEIRVDDIRNNLARRNAARHRLAAAVAPVRDYQPPVIPDDEVLVNLSKIITPANERRTAHHVQAVAEKISRSRIAAQAREHLLEKNPAEKTVGVRKLSEPIEKKQTQIYISRPPEPDATVVEPPPVPKTPAPVVDIPPPPVFETRSYEQAVAVQEAVSLRPEVKEPKKVAEAYISDHPVRSIRDFLISESGAAEEEGFFEPAPPADSESESAALQTAFGDLPLEDEKESGYGEDSVVDTVRESDLTPSFSEKFHQEKVSESYQLPTTALLLPPQFDPAATQTEEVLLEKSIIIEEKLAEFKVKVKVVDSYSGPVITRYEIEPDVGVRGNAVLNLEKDLARSLGVASIRVVETIPGKTCMGLELPNPKRQIIRLSEIFNSEEFKFSKSKLTLALGQDITGKPVVTDLAKAPHLLVAGTTGSGKSVGVNAMILSMLFKARPEDVRMIMIDPKMLELSIYEGIPHLLAPVVTDMKLAANALNWCVNEMEKRYRLMSHLMVRNLAGFNQKITEAEQQGRKIPNPFSLTPEQPESLEKLPFIVVVVDEFADLMMTAGKKIEELIARLAQKARAAGIHLILATQRPSVDVITGLIKANIPTRIAFQVSSKIDSRTILDQMGAENLLGQGDMLFLPPGTGYPQRVHGAFASDDEVHHVVEYLKQFGEPDYVEDILSSGSSEEFASIGRNNDTDIDPMYDEAVSLVLKTKKASISSVQRALRIGYNRAARLIDQMETDGIVSPPETNGNRTVIAPNAQLHD